MTPQLYWQIVLVCAAVVTVGGTVVGVAVVDPALLQGSES